MEGGGEIGAFGQVLKFVAERAAGRHFKVIPNTNGSGLLGNGKVFQLHSTATAKARARLIN